MMVKQLPIFLEGLCIRLAYSGMNDCKTLIDEMVLTVHFCRYDYEEI